MKKFCFFAAMAILALAACTKVEVAPEAQKEISFEVAKYVQTKATSGAKYDESLTFGTYAWFTASNGSTNADFMTNEQVGLVSGKWKTMHNTFYWPKTGSIDFISYSPFAGTSGTAGTVPTVTATTINYNDIVIAADDLMYADKVNCSANMDEIKDDLTPGSSDSGYTGVPTLFHHALAKLSFKMNASFLTYTDNTTSPANTTTWEVKVTKAKIKGIYTEGSCALTWDASNKVWTKPAGEVWTPKSGSTLFEQDLVTSPVTLKASPDFTDLASVSNAYVMPQTLVAGAQQLELVMEIKTKLANGNDITENYSKTLDLSAISTIPSWKMNENIVYTISIKPTSSADPSNPNMDDPTDVTITFDPAVADWTNVDTTATIQL